MPASTVVTIGNFDGVHRGHLALIQRARRLAGPAGQVSVLTFDRPPAVVLRPENAPQRLTTPDRRDALLRQAGADSITSMAATADFLALSPEQFFDWVLQNASPTAFVEGADFRFGCRRQGDVDLLKNLAAAHGLTVDVLEHVEARLTDDLLVPVSSSLIRWMLAQGRVRDAAALLGRPHRLEGVVRPGQKRGRSIGIPTANLECDLMLPRFGVYAARALVGGKSYPAAVNVGRRPTVASSAAPTCEAHLIGYDGPLDSYDWTLSLDLYAFIRDELRFPSVDALAAQIRRDLIRAQRLTEDESPAA